MGQQTHKLHAENKRHRQQLKQGEIAGPSQYYSPHKSIIKAT